MKFSGLTNFASYHINVNYATVLLLLRELLMVSSERILTKDDEDIVFGRNGRASDTSDFYCYHCVSPYTNIQNQAMRNKLEALMNNRYVDFAKLLHDGEYSYCDLPRNYTALRKRRCDFPYCYELKATDMQGRPFVIRSCGEVSGVQMAVLNREITEDKCERPARGVEIRECFCRTPLCNVGPNKGHSLTADVRRRQLCTCILGVIIVLLSWIAR